MNIPNSYRLQDGCYNCKLVYVHAMEWDSDTFYCTRNASPRPKSGSIHEKFEANTSEPLIESDLWDNPEDIETVSFKEWKKWYQDNIGIQYDVWREWAQYREVKIYGMCNNHER